MSAHIVDKGIQRLFASADIAYGNEFAGFVNVKHGFNIDQGTEYLNGLRDTAALVEVLKVLNCELMAEMLDVVVNPGSHLIERLALLLELDRVVYQKSLSARSTERVDDNDPGTGMALHDLLGSDACALVAARKSGRETEVKNIVAGIYLLLEDLLADLGSTGGCGNLCVMTHTVEKLLKRHLVAGTVLHIVYIIVERMDRNTMLPDIFCGKVRCGICGNKIFVHIWFSCKSKNQRLRSLKSMS
jgi:hypothetical protein